VGHSFPIDFNLKFSTFCWKIELAASDWFTKQVLCDWIVLSLDKWKITWLMSKPCWVGVTLFWLHKRKSSKGHFVSSKEPLTKSDELTLIGKSWKTRPLFFRNLNFRGISGTDFWKIHPSIFCEYLFSFCKISGHKLDRFLGNSSIFGRVFQELARPCPKILKLTIGWVFHKSSSSYPGNSPISFVLRL